ncbi:MAG: glycosyltransferase family 4 protein, partial [Chloroflexi bacterium]|nr:glycosyltransferase family 4 protein [Chloroflexota bacterium]
TTLLTQHLREQGHEVLLLSFSRQYPSWLFPGKSDKDPSERPLQTEAEYLLDPLNPLSWWRTLRRIQQWQPDAVIMQWWHPYFTPVWSFISRAIKRIKPAPRLVFICHNVLPHETGGRLGQIMQPIALKLALRTADQYIVHSQADGAILADTISNANYCVTPLPTYAALGSSAQADTPIDLPDDRPLLLFCGFVRPYKGLDILIDAL